MVKFHIQADSPIPMATQLFDQLSFAISSLQYPPGSQLPSTRQLAAWTGVHRNTVSKVYQQLKQTGLVLSRPGAGIFVHDSLKHDQTPGDLARLARQTIDRIVQAGYSLEQARAGLLAEVEWRLRATAQILVSCHAHDPGVATIMASQIRHAINLPVQIVTIEDLPQLLQTAYPGTIVTNRYLYEATCQAVSEKDIRVIALDIYHYQQELERVKAIPSGSYVGIVSASKGILRIAESIIRSARGEELTIVTACPHQSASLKHLAQFAHVILVGDSSTVVDQAVAAAQPSRIRPVEVIYCDSYIARESMERLKLELGMVNHSAED